MTCGSYIWIEICAVEIPIFHPFKERNEVVWTQENPFGRRCALQVYHRVALLPLIFPYCHRSTHCKHLLLEQLISEQLFLQQACKQVHGNQPVRISYKSQSHKRLIDNFCKASTQLLITFFIYCKHFELEVSRVKGGDLFQKLVDVLSGNLIYYICIIFLSIDIALQRIFYALCNDQDILSWFVW